MFKHALFVFDRTGDMTFVMAGTFLRLSSIAIQGSFYPVYLKSISLSGTTIGLLMGAIAAFAGPAAFAVGWPPCSYDPEFRKI